MAYQTLGKYMSEFVSLRKTELRNQCFGGEPQDLKDKADLLTRLVRSSETDGKLVLDDKELVSTYDLNIL